MQAGWSQDNLLYILQPWCRDKHLGLYLGVGGVLIKMMHSTAIILLNCFKLPSWIYFENYLQFNYHTKQPRVSQQKHFTFGLVQTICQTNTEAQASWVCAITDVPVIEKAQMWLCPDKRWIEQPTVLKGSFNQNQIIIIVNYWLMLIGKCIEMQPPYLGNL